MFSLYSGYVLLIKYNAEVRRWVLRKLRIKDKIREVEIREDKIHNVISNLPNFRAGTLMNSLIEDASTFRAAIMNLLIKDRGIMEVIHYQIVLNIGNVESTFEKFDQNIDGHIDKEELQHAFNEMDILSQEEKAYSDLVFEIIDTDQK